MVEAVVEYDYTAQEPDELTIRKGDVIREIIKKPGGWWEGTLRDKRGMFPDNFVTLILKDRVTQRSKPGRSTRQCKAIFSYHPAHEDELSLSVGDVIDVLGEVEEGWWRGKIGDLEGVFPSNFVAEIDAGKTHSKHSSKEDLTNVQDDINTPSLPPKPSTILCQVKYPYDACNEDELTLREGEIITLISKDGQDRGWWKGKLNGKIGVFPDNFVTVIPTPELNGPPQHKQLRQEKVGNKNEPKTNIAAQRMSLEVKLDKINVPPVPGKKPSVAKPAPEKIMKRKDTVDGAVGSKPKEDKREDSKDHDLDQVAKTPLLSDIRATRPKAPGRRPPSTVYRDNELVNGNALNSSNEAQENKSETSNDEEEGERKPKQREWEKNKAPWMEELKLKQDKRTSVSPNSNVDKKIDKPEKLSPEDIVEPKVKSPATHEESSPNDMSKSMSSIGNKLKPESDYVVLRNKSQSQPITITPVRPQSIHSGSPMETKISPSSQAQKPPIAEKINIHSKNVSPRSSVEKKQEFVSMKQYVELVDKVTQMEKKMLEMQAKIDELQGKLQIESDMRRLFQVELDKVAQCVTQV